MSANWRRWAAAASMALLAALMVPAVLPAVGASPVTPASAGTPGQWAYGAEKWDNASATFLGGTYDAKAFFGWEVVATATNTSATTREIEGVRTIGVSYYVEYCRPNCSAPNATANLSLTAFQETTAFVNLTTTASVDLHVGGSVLNATMVPALGVANATSIGRAGLNESYAITRGTRTGASGMLAATRSSDVDVAFSPALGLLPWNVSAGDTWNASSAFTASGGFSDAFNHSDDLRSVTSAQSGSASVNVSHRGTETVRGRDLGNVTLSNGANVTAVVLGYLGPFGFGDGLFMNFAAADLFDGTTASWAGFAFAAGQAAPSAIDLAIRPGAHVATAVAASGSLGVGSTAVGAANLETGTGATVGSPSNPPSSNETVQAQPESPASANAESQCLVSGCGGGASSGPGAASHLFGLLLIGGVVVVVVAGVALLLTRRPRRPTTSAGGPSSPA